VLLRLAVKPGAPPVFGSESIDVLVGGEQAIPDKHAAPAVADWDGDGKWDLIVGGQNGAVYWMRNTGTRGKPEFKTREMLIGTGEGVDQWVPLGEQPRRGTRSQPQVFDYNGDGKLDLLVGDWSNTITPREGLSAEETKKMQALRERIAAIDKKVKWDGVDLRSHHLGYSKVITTKNGEQGVPSDDSNEVTDLRQQLSAYLQMRKTPHGEMDITTHGSVWVFLRN
jgi:hypothetical protein